MSIATPASTRRPRLPDTSAEFQQRFDPLLQSSEACRVLRLVAAELNRALATHGYRTGVGSIQPTSDQGRGLRMAQSVTPFEDPLSGLGYTSVVRLYVTHMGTLHRASIWGDFRLADRNQVDANSVCHSMSEQGWADLTQAQASAAFQELLETWALAEHIELISGRAMALATDLTGLLSP